ncbi:alpha/beta fold hydrolase [Egicoccus sp. AB-alg2]|uniref:alpha/beta fold hydrolase n=1 Tax=Egicoccus sp. AB-alg2 TaxID=3242693 RepID=UPI00359D1A07
MPHAQLDGHQVPFEDVGGEGPPILLSPGADSTAATLRERLDVFGAVYRLLAWDPPQVAAQGSDRIREHARMALDLLHHQGIERAVFAGDGVGALIAVRAGLSAPDRVRGLLLFDLPGGEVDELRRLYELDIPTLVVHSGAGGRTRDEVTALAEALRDNRGVHLLDDEDPALATTRAAAVDAAIRDYLESLPA